MYVSVLERLEHQVVTYRGGTRTESFVLRELRGLGAINFEGIGPVSRVMTVDQFIDTCRAKMAARPYSEFWRLVKELTPYEEAIRVAFRYEDLAPSTRQSLGVMLVNWGKNLGFLDARRYRKGLRLDVRRAPLNDSSLFDGLFNLSE